MNQQKPHLSPISESPPNEQNEITTVPLRVGLLQRLLGYLSRSNRSKVLTEEPCYSCSQMDMSQQFEGAYEALIKARNRIYLERFYDSLCMVQPQKVRNRKASNSYLGSHVFI